MKRAPDAPSPARLGAVLDALPPLDIGGLQVRIDPRSRNGLGYTDLTVLTREGKLVG